MNCSNCGATNPAGMKFCGHCGAALLPASPEPQAELRQLTVLFCDLVGSTELSSRMDPEELREVTQEYHDACAEAVAVHEGHIAQYLGDGILVYFGYPVAHEDDASRAVRTARGILERLDRLNERLRAERGIGLQARIGIHTGPVVIGDVGGGEGRREHLAMGQTPNVAARIQSAARPDTVVVSEETRKIVTGFFEFEALGAADLKGLSEGLSLYRVLGESGAQSRIDVGRQMGLTAFTGRDPELKRLHDFWVDVRRHGGGSAVLRGEPGIGKSRLADAFRAQVASTDHVTILECACSPYYRSSALHPVIGILERGLGFTGDVPEDRRLRELEMRLAARGLLTNERLAVMASLLSVPLDDQVAAVALSPQEQRDLTLRTLLDWLMTLAGSRPLLLVVEDIHWADPTTLEFLGTVQESFRSVALMLLLTQRPGFSPPWPEMGDRALEIDVERLAPEHTGSMAVQVAGGKRLPADVVQRIVSRTDGVPLFVEEVTKTVIETGVLVEKEDRFELTGPLPEDLIPSSVQASLHSRLDRLGPAKATAQLAATIGREFRYDVLREVARTEDDTLREHVDRLVEAGLVYRLMDVTEEHYQFKHSLVQDAAYRSLLKKARRSIHGRIAEALASRPAVAERQPELLAHHYAAAGLAEPAARAWLLAAQQAAARAAHHETIAHVTRALEVVSEVPEPDGLALELDLHFTIIPAIQLTEGWASARLERTYVRCLEVVELLGTTPLRIRVLTAAFAFHLVVGHVDMAVSVSDQVVEAARALQMPQLVFVGAGNRCVARLYHGEIARAVEAAEVALESLDDETHEWVLRTSGLSGRVYVHCYYSEALWMAGYPDRAAASIEEAVTAARRIEHMPSLAFALGYATEFYPLLRDPDSVLRAAEENKAIEEERRSAFWEPLVSTYRGWALAMRGQQEEGIRMTRDGIARYREAGNGLTLVHMLGSLAETLGHAERWNEALQLLAQAMAIPGRTGERYYEPELYRLRGEIGLTRALAEGTVGGDVLTQAERDIREALRLASHQGAQSLELRAAMALHRLSSVHEPLAAEARRTLTDIHARFTEGFDTPDLLDARRFLGLS